MGSVKRIEERREALVCLSLGYSQTDTARKVGVSREAVRAWLKEGDFRKQLDRLVKARDAELPKRIKALAARAVNKIAVIMETGPATVQLRAAQDLADRGGWKARERVGDTLADAIIAMFSDEDEDEAEVEE